MGKVKHTFNTCAGAHYQLACLIAYASERLILKSK